MSEANLKVNFKKCAFFKAKIKFLGRVLGGFTKSTKEESVEHVQQMKPGNAHALRSFPWAGDFRNFIKAFSARVKLLNNMLQKKTDFIWTNECEKAYNNLVSAILSDPVLMLPDLTLPFELANRCF